MKETIAIILPYITKAALAVIVLVVGLFIIKKVVKIVEKLMKKREVDETLIPFCKSLTSVGLHTCLIICVASMVGIETTSFIAILGAAGLAVGLALQGSLSNFAGGVLILLFKPFKVGDLITAQGHTGIVKEIQVFNTIMTSLDNKRIIIPNGNLSNNDITNISAEPELRVDFTFGIGYNDDIDQAKSVIKEVLNNTPEIIKEKGMELYVGELADSSVNILTRVWAKNEDYWTVFFSVTENVKKAFDSKQISIPYPQLDVHLPTKN